MTTDGLPLLLRSFGLTTMAGMWEETLACAERENWGYARLVRQLCESEAQDRRERRTQRLLKAARLPDGKTLGNLNEKLLPAKLRRLLPTLLEGHFVGRAENVLAFGLPGRGKTYFLAALGRELILRHDCTVLFTPTYKLVQQLLAAKQALCLEAQLRELDRYAVVILD
jgi:DNA replication protein DnaC